MSAVDVMPLVMPDGTQVDLDNVDDLFGGELAEELSLPMQPYYRFDLRRRLSDMHRSGCCRAVAWSKMGIVASISRDGFSVQLRTLRASPKDASWSLGAPTTCVQLAGSFAARIVHLAWGGSSTMSAELAAIDSAGRVAIVHFSALLNHGSITRRFDLEPIDNSFAVVGSLWLPSVSTQAGNPQRRWTMSYGPAVRSTSDSGVHNYHYQTGFVPAGLAFPMANRSGLVTVTANGLVRLMWTSARAPETASVELGSIMGSQGSITHASITVEKQSLLVAVAKSKGTLWLFQVTINWNLAPDFKTTMAMRPTMTAKCLCRTVWDRPIDNESGSAPWLTSITVLPSATEGQDRHPPQVLVTRVRPPSAYAFEPPLTVIDRWKVADQKQALHPALLALGRKAGAPPPELGPITALEMADPIVINKTLIDVHPVPANTAKVLVFSYADGSMEHRDRWPLEEELYTEPMLERVGGLRNVGFQLEKPEECLQVAFSPTECSVVRLTDNHSLVWDKLKHTGAPLGTSRKDALFAAVVSALTITISAALNPGHSYDDVLAIMRTFDDTTGLLASVVADVVRMNKVHLDYGQLDPDNQQPSQAPNQAQQQQQQQQQPPQEPIQNGVLAGCLGLICHMNFSGQFHARSHVCQMALLTLMAKSTAVLATIALSSSKSAQPINIFDDAEAVEAFASNAKWTLDLFSYIFASLDDLRRDTDFMAALGSRERSPHIHQLLAARGQPVVHYMLCSATRGILLTLARRMAHILAIAGQAAEHIRKTGNGVVQSPVQAAYIRLHCVAQDSPVKATDFMALCNFFAHECRDRYRNFRNAMLSGAQKHPNAAFDPRRAEEQFRQRIVEGEMNFILGGPIIPPWLQALQALMKNMASFLDGTYVAPGSTPPTPTRAIDRSQLFTWNFDLVALPQRLHVLQRWERNRRHVDMFRRVAMMGPPHRVPDTPMPSAVNTAASPGMMDGSRWRRCVRCAGVMQNVQVAKQGYQMLLRMLGKCPCGGNWVLLERGADFL